MGATAPLVNRSPESSMRRMQAFARFLALSVLVAGCGRAGNDPRVSGTAGPSRALRIAVIPKGTTHVFWKSVHAGALRAARELSEGGQGVEIQWKGPLLEND